MAQDIVLAVLSPIVDHTIGPIKAHICYALYCKSNLRNLEEEVGKLKNEREKLQHSVEEERRNGKVIEQDVDRWLLEVGRIIESRERELVQDEDRAKKKCFVGLCPNFKTRYQLGKKAKGGLSTVMMKLEEQAKFGSISYRAAPAGMSAMSVKGYEAMPSRIPILMEIMNALKLADVKMVGVYGMGGIGKTTLVKEVAVEAMKNKLFDKMVIATVTQNQDIMKIQGQIADQLGLKFDEESEWGRASRLRDRLKQEKKILIVLDDLWKRLDLDAVGISFEDGQKECKMLLTSRESDVLSSGMDVQKNFPLHNLQEEEAWDLFKITAGGNVENPDVQSVAFKIAKKCAGLPVAIVTVAKALKDKSLPQWKDALRDLQKPSPRNFTGVPGEVYGAIELSYKHLESEELKSTFLLCSRMGYNASIEDLLKYGMGLGLFFGVATTEEARNKVYSLVHKLKNSCLLLDGNTSKQFSIHDVVRDVATSIAFRDHDVIVRSSNEVEVEWPDKDSLKYTEIWLHGNSIGLSKDLKYPMLKVFNMHSEDPSLEIPGNMFGGMQKLKVLGLTNFSLPSVPSSLHLLKNLCSLCLHQSSLGEIAIIGELKNLEFLSFVKSTIKHLPREIGGLTKLKLLDLSDCSELEVISPNVISSLSLLQELCLGNSFHRWDIGPNNASLVELKHLSRLTNLEIHVPDSTVILKDLFSRKLERYRIFIGDVWDWDGVYETSRTLKLKLDERAYHLEQGILKLLKQTEDLYILEWKGVKNVICELDREGFPLLKHLHLQNSPEIQYIIDTMDGVLSNISLFPMLESLFLYNLVSLEKIYHGTLRTQSLGKLQSLEVENCNKLKKLFSFSMARGLSQLQSIKITSCLNMEEVVAEESEEFDSRNEGTDAMEFTQLRFISLQYLPRLRKFYSREKTSCASQTQSKSLIADAEFGESILNEVLQPPMQLLDNKIVFPKLEKLDLRSINTDRLWNGQLPAVSIQNLQKLVVDQCENLKYIFSSSMVKSLVQLKLLTVRNCKSVEEIVVAEEEIMSNMLFPKIEEIRLWSLPKLKQFCTGSVIECPLLKRLTIGGCNGLETFISDFRSTNFTISNEAPELNLEEKCSNATQPLFDEKVIFPRLAEIQIWNLGNLENIWHYQLAAGSFCELRSIQIRSCHKLVNIFGEENQASDAFQLRVPHLISQPKLKQLWKEDPQAIHNFRNLHSIRVLRCDVLKNLFPLSIARGLPQLGKLEIESCGSLREIVAKVEDDEAGPRFEFPQLTSVSLAYLGKFRNFYPGKHTLVCPILTSLAVLGEGQHHKSTQQPLFFFEKAISNLEELSLDGEGTSTTSIIRWHSKLGPDFDSRLKVLKLCNFKKKSDPISFGYLQRLRNLETLYVTRSSFKRLFLDEGLVDEEHAWTLEKFTKLVIESVNDIRHLWEEDHPLVPFLQNLKTLRISICQSLVNLAPSFASFQNLSTLEVILCYGLLNLITSSTAKSLVQLVKLTINYCDNVTEIVAKQEEETEDEIVFSKLEYLELVGLQSLTSFCSGNYNLKFPSLTEMVVERCPKMRIFSPATVSTPKLQGVCWQRYPKNRRCWQANLNSTILQLYRDMVRFNGSRNLKLSSFPQLKEAWDGQLPVNLYSHLSDITVDDCPSFSVAIPSNVLQFMHNVENLTVINCDSLEGVFDLDGLNAEEGHARLLPKLRKLNLLSLPRLKHIWNKDPEGILDFKNLEVLKVHNCSSLRNIFTPSMALGLVQLREMEIRNCAMVGEIIAEERAEQASIERFIFPLLKVIILESLPNLTSIYSGSGILEIPSLEELTIDSGRHMKAFVSSILKDPSLINEGKVQRPGKGEHAISSAPLLNHKAISNLEEQSLGGQGTSTTSIIRWHSKRQPDFDFRLKVLKLHNFKKKSDPIPFGFFQRLCNLETLFVTNSSFKRLFLNEGLIDEEQTWTPEQFANLEMVSVHDLRRLWEEDHPLVPLLQNLKTLQVKSCFSLVNLAPSSASFQNLSTLKVDFCTGLLNLITASTAKSLVQLVKLTINYCDNVTEIVAKQEEETEDEIVFSKLEYLELVGLKSLTSFCSGNYNLKFPSLKEMVVERCPKMRIFSPTTVSTPKLQGVCWQRYPKNKRRWQGNLNSTIQQMYTEMVGFNGSRNLKLSCFPQLKEKWCGQLPVTFYNHLSDITMNDCPSLSIAIPSNVLQFMDDLEHLRVRNCDSLEGVFDLDGLNAEEGHARLLPKLRKLNLLSLPRLKHVWNKDPKGILYFKNLKVLKVHNCSSLRNIFTLSMALGLVQLHEMEIRNCAMVEEIIIEERAEQASIDRLLLPLLKVIVLQSLPNLTSIYSGSGILEIPSIEEITVDSCPHMKTFVSSILREKDPSPTNEGKVQRPGKGEHDISTAPLLNHKVAFPNLEKLSVEWNDILEVIRHDQFREEFFCKLKVLELVHFPNDYIDFHFLCHFLQKFTNLEKIVIKDALFEEIVLHEETNSGKKHMGVLAQLKELKLSRLPKLVHLSNEDSLLCPVFQNLEKLDVFECGRLKMLVHSSMSFQCLTNLKVSKCHGLINLMTSSTAKRFVQLTRMSITECDLVEEIVVNKEREAETEVVFPKLKNLTLRCLPNLARFHLENCAFMFPFLEVVIVKECPKMEIFSQGVIITPELERVITERDLKGYFWEDDLNSTIQKLFVETGNGVAQSKLPSSSKQPISACDVGQANKDGLSVVSGGQASEVLLITETPDTIKDLPPIVEMIHGTNKHISKGVLNDKEDSKQDQSSPISICSETQICLQVQKVPQSGPPQDKVMPASSIQKSGYVSNAAVGEPVPISPSTASFTDSMPASKTSSVDLIKEKSYSPADFKFYTTKNLSSDFDATDIHIAEEKATRSAVMEHENSQLAITYQDSHKASNDKEDPTGCQNSPMNIDSRTHISLHFEKDTQGIAEEGEPSQEQATPGSSIQRSNPIPSAITARKNLPHDSHNASKDKDNPTQCRNSSTNKDIRTHVSLQFEKDTQGIAEEGEPSQEQATPCSSIQQSNPISPPITARRDLPHDSHNASKDKEDPTQHRNFPTAMETITHISQQFKKDSQAIAKSEPSQEQVRSDSSIQQSNPISPAIAVEGDATSTLAFPEKISSHSPANFESLFARVEQLLNPSPASSSQSASNSNTQPESHKSNGMSLETYGYSMALIKKILTKPLEEVARSYDRLSLLSALRNLKNCHLLNSRQSEIIQIYVENFDSLVTYHPFYEQEIGRTSALKSSIKDWEKEITELKTLYEDLASKIVNLIAFKEELKKKLRAIEEEDHIQEKMEILYAQLVSGKEKLETGIYALPESERQQREAEDRANNANDYWAKIKSLFAKSEPSQEQVTPDLSIQQSNPISPVIAVEGDATSTLAFPAKISSHSRAKFESLFASVGQLLNPSPASSSQSASISNTQPESHRSNSMNLETYGYSIALIKKILTKSLEEVARSYDRLSLLSALRNLKNCPFLNSQQSEIIQIYVENFDSLVTYYPFYDQEIDRTSALKSSVKDWEKEITELKNLYEDLSSKIVNRIAAREELKKKLCEIQEEEDHIQEQMEILYAQLVSGKEKLETGMYALPESERQQREAEDRANNANDYWAKIRSLFA